MKPRKLRVRAGLTQRGLGDLIPLAHSRIAQFELGKETPPEDVNTRLDALLEADLADNLPGTVPVRDSKHLTGPVLLIGTSAWAAFVEGIRHNRR